MTFETGLSILSQGTAIGVLVGVGWFVAFRIWPWWEERDTEERQRQHERRLAEIQTDGYTASALSALAEAVKSCPFRPPGAPGAPGGRVGDG